MIGKIFMITGPSSSGKDAIYNGLREIFKDKLMPIVMYSTRPRRNGEINGREYHFIDDNKLKKLENKIIESRVYDVIVDNNSALWTYATVDDGTINLNKNNYIMVGPLKSVASMRKYFDDNRIIPFFIEVDQSIRIERAIAREQNGNHNYNEMCRRWLADMEDFSKSKIEEAEYIFKVYNNSDLDSVLFNITKIIIQNI